MSKRSKRSNKARGFWWMALPVLAAALLASTLSGRSGGKAQSAKVTGSLAPTEGIGPGQEVPTLRALIDADYCQQAGHRFDLPQIREALDRGKGLLRRLQRQAGAARFELLAADLAHLEAKFHAAEDQASEFSKAAGRDLFLNVRWQIRRIAFMNPLLDIDKLLFVTRHDAGGIFHMCDQYYGCNAKPGGGLYVLKDPVRLPAQAERIY